MRKILRRLVPAAAATLLAGASLAVVTNDSASAAPACTGAYQIGSTGYVKWGSMTVASGGFLGRATFSGLKASTGNDREAWSGWTDTATVCTQAYGGVDWTILKNGRNTSMAAAASSSERC